MRRIVSLTLLLLLLSHPCWGRDFGGAQAQVLQDFERILDLWRDGRYDELYLRTVTTGKEGKEQFARHLASAPRRPACCWEKMQDARVTMKSGRTAVVFARLGFEGAVPGTEFVTKGIKMKKQDDVWLISQSDLFSLGKLTKTRVRYRYLPPR
jgi:hypothetical protein